MSYSEISNGEYNFSVKVSKESDISWEVQNKIHYLLNLAFSKKSKSFLNKTYSRTVPSERVIIFSEDTPVAHMGISYDQIIVNDHKVDVGCMGLWCADRIRDP